MSDTSWPTARYRLLERAYIGLFPGDDHGVREAGVEILYDGKPGPHMEPLDDAAREAVERAGPQVMNFAMVAPLTAATEDDLMVERTAAAVAKAMAPFMAMLAGVNTPKAPAVVSVLPVAPSEIVVPPPPMMEAPPLPPKAAPKR